MPAMPAMPAMSQIERVFCQGVLWRGSGNAVVGSLPVDRLGRDVLEIGSGSADVAARLQEAMPGQTITATDLDPAMIQTAIRRAAAVPRRHRAPCRRHRPAVRRRLV